MTSMEAGKAPAKLPDGGAFEAGSVRPHDGSRGFPATDRLRQRREATLETLDRIQASLRDANRTSQKIWVMQRVLWRFLVGGP